VSFTVRVAAPAARVFSRLDAVSKARVEAVLHSLGADPLSPAHSKPLHGEHGTRGARVGGWRILFRADIESRTVDVLAIRRRGQAYPTHHKL
jgi:mRNA-degrading endonuclease RelE of RelBE toxin-antitoxin system